MEDVALFLSEKVAKYTQLAIRLTLPIQTWPQEAVSCRTGASLLSLIGLLKDGIRNTGISPRRIIATFRVKTWRSTGIFYKWHLPPRQLPSQHHDGETGKGPTISTVPAEPHKGRTFQLPSTRATSLKA